ncbi:hypothetical protein EVC23_008 [Rhizobium phage RHph_N3_8]|uniref:hypothetical protein n=1 Tax=Rhizobium phage RHph_N3_8 TaxID=2509748 RepID=UPI001AF16420|nr:hypothetical protein QEJ65_gp08 [Rhizobium phage RHph_N3_8]QIG76007.1 hypothetical protein EVC23_008 [Rhizobium phage RHph_N3_8]
MANLGDKRRKALQQHRAVTKKISRIKGGTGAEVAGTDQDPRKSPEFIRNADEKALNALIRRQDKFLDRSVQFVPDAHNKPLPSKMWAEFKQAEDKYNQHVQKFYQDYKDIYIEPSGQTVDSRMLAITPLHAHMGQRTTDSPYKERNKSSRSVYGESGLRALIKDLKNRSTMAHEKRALQNHRNGVMKMLQATGDLEAMEMLGKLTHKQWALVWKYTKFASQVRVPYQHYKDALDGKKGVINSQMVQTDLAVAKEHLRWAVNVKDIRGRL